ncbi:alpha/beta hydrolase [Nocardia huaxiensis]|uniref:Alpha/beta hydrolase n=1 Tax=Nocardia huaxiensis TaxID=2755382 RepID=A0A7D6ZAX4_9NOCA|nr:alpha/beta hydrolase [Nocardia huaxiensis]QLY29338.1 alpha/beta hydrolase [Nocardia huaxiensis]UFS97184.1 alpha/beta hydrolase [Nocardia huaxiensis]
MRWTRAALLASTFSILVTTGCGAGPSDRPAVAVERPHQGGVVAPSTTPGEATVPEPETPKTDLTWRDCTAPTFNLLSLGAPPAGLVLECAEYTTQVDATGTVAGNFRTAALRARTDKTPLDVAPLVLTSGTDRASTATLAGLAAGPGGTATLAARPIVAVDRRGIGSSQAVNCMTTQIRADLANQAQFTRGTTDPVDAVAGLSQDATIACLDFLTPAQNTFDNAHAADDIEQLRRQWQVEHISLLGTGSGAAVALSYVRKYGDHLARLVLDSPQPVGLDAVGRAEQQVRGSEAALTAFAQRCAGLGCSLGGDPRTAVIDLVNKAGSGALGELSAAALVTTLSGFLSDPRMDNAQITQFADALSALGRGDRGPIGPYVLREAAAIANDGAFVNECSDNLQPATPVRAKELATTWATQYPVFGKVGAIDLMVCSAWPAAAAVPSLTGKFDKPVLVLGGNADPVSGPDARPTVTGVLGTVGARTATVVWQGWGHPTYAHSGCAQQAVDEYLKGATLPADGTACPA